METKNYNASILVPLSIGEAINEITNVSAWWSTDFTGSAQREGDEFTVSFGETFVTQRVEEMSDKKIIWLVTDCYKHWLKGNKQEWNGTTIVFEFSAKGDETQIDFTHIGLVPGIECYEGCEDGWNFYIKESLFKLLTEGKGIPNT